MPIYEQGYESYSGPRKSLKWRWIPLFREEITPFLKKRRFIVLLLMALVPWLYGIALTFLHTQLGDGSGMKEFIAKLPVVDEKLFATLLSNGWDIFLLFIVVIWVGSGLISRDRRDKTLEVFLSRALGPAQYAWAKGLTLGVFLMVFSLLPALVLIIFQVGLTGDPWWVISHFRVVWGTLLYAILGDGSVVLFVLALSSLSRSPRTVGLLFIGIIFLGDAACGILYLITKSPLAWFFSIAKEMSILADRCLGAPVSPHYAIGLPMSVLFFVLMAGGGAGILALRFSGRKVLS